MDFPVWQRDSRRRRPGVLSGIMAECDSSEETSLLAYLQACFGESDSVNNLISPMSNMETTEKPLQESDSAGDAGSDSLNQCEELDFSIDIPSALGSVASISSWDFGKLQSAVPELFSLLTLEEDNAPLSPPDDQDASSERAADSVEEEALSLTFQSKYIHIFPLYQDYCLQAVEDDLLRPDTHTQTVVSELTTPQSAQSLQSHISLFSYSPSSRKLSSPELPSPPPHLIQVTPCTLWQDLDEVKAAGVLDSLTPREIRHQEAMFELIGSEASYLRSLGVAVDHFYDSKAMKATLSRMEHHILFSNICQVKAASEKFLKDLEARLGACVFISQVGDIVLEHCPAFHTLYVSYVTNMMYQEALIKQLMQQNRDFVFLLTKLERDPVCQRQSLKSFLVLPFQRITRIKLILQTILKLTGPECDSFSTLEKAIEAIHGIVSACDEGVKKMKQIEELVCLEMLLDFGNMKAVPLVASGRSLVHQGPVRQLQVETYRNSRPSFTSVYLHLFSDMLLISSKKEQRFMVEDHAEFPAHVHTDNLKTEVLGLPPESFLLRLSKSRTGQPTAMILVAYKRSDKETWMKLLSSKH